MSPAPPAKLDLSAAEIFAQKPPHEWLESARVPDIGNAECLVKLLRPGITYVRRCFWQDGNPGRHLGGKHQAHTVVMFYAADDMRLLSVQYRGAMVPPYFQVVNGKIVETKRPALPKDNVR